MKTDAARDRNHPVSALGARLQPRETLLLDGSSLPLELEPAPADGPLARVICFQCAESAERAADIPHEDWCLYAGGPVCPAVPN